MLDKARLAKVLAMTTSSHDGEALAAIRKANEIIAGENLRWEDILAGGGTNIQIVMQRQPMQEAYSADEDWTPPHLTDKVMIDTMFRAIYAQPRTGNEGFWEFMDSVHAWYRDSGRLTPRQYKALMQSYQRVTRSATTAAS